MCLLACGVVNSSVCRVGLVICQCAGACCKFQAEGPFLVHMGVAINPVSVSSVLTTLTSNMFVDGTNC